MLELYSKILKTRNRTIKIDPTELASTELDIIGKKLNSKILKLFRGSLAIREVDAGSDNSIEQELVALSNAYYDVERFGIHFVASPKHADMLMVSGPVTRNMAEALRRAYASTPDPKIIVAVGDDAIDGGIYKGSYAIYDGVDSVIPVNYCIPGDPPSPKSVIYHLLKILEDVEHTSDKKSK
jgi:Ni,Fe-hydrogenase III small subunit